MDERTVDFDLSKFLPAPTYTKWQRGDIVNLILSILSVFSMAIALEVRLNRMSLILILFI
jgi:hypothetical protein